MSGLRREGRPGSGGEGRRKGGVGVLLLLAALGAGLPAEATAQTERERLEAEREALERARDAMERARERLEAQLEQRGDREARLRLEGFRMPDMQSRVPEMQYRMQALGGALSRARLGISMGAGEDEEADAPGARVLSVDPDGPAERAGLRAGDVITALGGTAVTAPLPDSELEAAAGTPPTPMGRVVALVRRLEPGDSVRVDYLRDGASASTTAVMDDARGITLWRAPRGETRVWSFPRGEGGGAVRGRIESPEPVRIRSFGGQAGLCAWGGTFGFPGCADGLELTGLNPGLGEYFGASSGVLVLSVADETPLGLRAGDVLLRIGDRAVEDPAQARRVLASYEEGDEVEFRVLRQQRETTVSGRMP